MTRHRRSWLVWLGLIVAFVLAYFFFSRSEGLRLRELEAELETNARVSLEQKLTLTDRSFILEVFNPQNGIREQHSVGYPHDLVEFKEVAHRFGVPFEDKRSESSILHLVLFLLCPLLVLLSVCMAFQEYMYRTILLRHRPCVEIREFIQAQRAHVFDYFAAPMGEHLSRGAIVTIDSSLIWKRKTGLTKARYELLSYDSPREFSRRVVTNLIARSHWLFENTPHGTDVVVKFQFEAIPWHIRILPFGGIWHWAGWVDYQRRLLRVAKAELEADEIAAQASQNSPTENPSDE